MHLLIMINYVNYNGSSNLGSYRYSFSPGEIVVSSLSFCKVVIAYVPKLNGGQGHDS